MVKQFREFLYFRPYILDLSIALLIYFFLLMILFGSWQLSERAAEKPIISVKLYQQSRESKPAIANIKKPVEKKTVEKTPVEKKPVEKKPVEKKPVEEKPVEEKPVEKKPVEKKPVEKKPVEEKPVEEKPVAEKPVEEKPVEEKPVEEKPVEEKPVEEKPVEEKPVEKIPFDKEEFAELALEDSNLKTLTSTIEAPEIEIKTTLTPGQQQQANQAKTDIKSLIEAHWIKPASVMPEMQVSIRLEVLPDGGIRSREIIENKGNKAFELSVLAAIDKIEKLPIPSDLAIYKEVFKTVTINFSPAP